MKNYAVASPQRQFHWFYRTLCGECGNLHYYRKYGKPEDRFDGRKMKHLCYPKGGGK